MWFCYLKPGERTPTKNICQLLDDDDHNSYLKAAHSCIKLFTIGKKTSHSPDSLLSLRFGSHKKYQTKPTKPSE